VPPPVRRALRPGVPGARSCSWFGDRQDKRLKVAIEGCAPSGDAIVWQVPGPDLSEIPRGVIPRLSSRPLYGDRELAELYWAGASGV